MTGRSHGLRALRFLVGTGVVSVLAFVCLGGSPTSAHPLGNFSVNHLHQLRFATDRIVDDVVIDTAEIPTAQADSIVDADADGASSAPELDVYGVNRCDDVLSAVELLVDGTRVALAVDRAVFTYEVGQAGLATSRLECRLSATVDLTTARSVSFSETYLTDRIGWREITAVGDGVRLLDSTVPESSVTDGLRTYPDDLLNSPLDVRAAALEVQPGVGPSTDSETARPDDHSDGLAATDIGSVSGIVDRVQRTFDDLIGRRELTLGVGLLAIGLALVLGGSHALLPGHGKTVMAAYIAGRQGSVKDALIVGATVTGTHTGGVLLLGLALTVSTALAGETVLGYLGVASGLLVAALGLGLLIGAIRHRGVGVFGHGHTHAYDLQGGHSHPGGSNDAHAHDGHSDDEHSHDGHSHEGQHHSHGGHVHHHGHSYQLDASAVASARMVGRGALARSAVVGGASGSSRVAVLDTATLLTPVPAVEADDQRHRHHPSAPTRRHVGRGGLIGMGIAGGLVPSPSALIILLSAIALGRTWFGVLLVVGYGAGMAGTLTLAGVLLVKMRDRYQQRMQTTSGRVRSAARRWGLVAPYFTAALVLVVGLGLAMRSAGLV